MKLFVGLFIALVILSIPTSAQEKNEVGLNIGATLSPSESLGPGASLIGPSGNVLPNRSLNFDSSLALGAEYDHRIVSGSRVAFYAGIDFLASPDDVQLSQRTDHLAGAACRVGCKRITSQRAVRLQRTQADS